MVSIHSPLMAKCLVLPLVPQASMPAYILRRGFKGVSENGSLGKGLGSGFRVLQIPIQLHHHGFHGKGRIMSKSPQATEEFGPVEHKSATTETLELLEWPRLCRALASFAATTLGKEQLHVCMFFTIPLFTLRVHIVVDGSRSNCLPPFGYRRECEFFYYNL